MLARLRDRMFRSFPLRTVLIVPYVLLLVITISIVGFLSYRNGQKAVNHVAHQLRSEITTRIKDNLEHFFEAVQQNNQSVKNLIQLGLLDTSDQSTLQQYFLKQVLISPTISSMYFGNRDGGIAGSGREAHLEEFYIYGTENFQPGIFNKYRVGEGGQPAELLTSLPDFDTRARAWYSNAVDKGDLIWNDIHILFTGQDMAIAVSQPIYDSQQNLLGVISQDIFLSQLNDLLKDFEIHPTGYSFIMERTGLLVASSSGEAMFTDLDNDGDMDRIDARMSQTPVINQTATFLLEKLENYNVTSSGEHQFEFEMDGERQFVQVTSIENGHGIDWLIVVVIPEATFLLQIKDNNRTTAGIIGLTLLISILLGIHIGRMISKRFDNLNQAAHALVTGNWEQAFAAPGMITEINSLAQSFNQSALQLQKIMENLTAEIAEREQVERTLRESEEHMRQIVQNMPILLDALDENNRFIAWNQECERVTGYTFEEITHHPNPMELLYPDPRQRQDMLEEVRAHNFSYRCLEWELTAKNGEKRSIIWSEQSAKYPIPGWYSWAVGVDITESKRIQRELQATNRSLRMISECNQVLVRAQDEQTLLNDICHTIVRYGGYPAVAVSYAENTEDKPIRMVAYTDDEERLLVNQRLSWSDQDVTGFGPSGFCIRSGKPCLVHEVNGMPDFEMLERQDTPDGSPCFTAAKVMDKNHPHFVHLNQSFQTYWQRGLKAILTLPLKDGENTFGLLAFHAAESDRFQPAEVNLLMELADDLSYGIRALRTRLERIQVMQSLQKSEEGFRLLIEKTHVGIFLSRGGQILYANPALQKMFGYQLDELTGKPFALFLPLRVREEHVQRNLRREQGMMEPEIYESVGLHKSGKEFSISLNVTLIDLADGPASIAFVIDLSQLKASQAEVQHQNEIFEVVSQAASRFLHFQNWDQEVQNLLEKLGQAMGTSRAFLIENRVDENGKIRIYTTFEWVAPGISSEIDNSEILGVTFEEVGLWRFEQILSRGEAFAGLVRDLTPEEQRVLIPQKIVAFLSMPIFIGNEWYGVIGFDECRLERSWSPAEIEALRTAANLLGASIELRRALESLERSEAMFRAVFDQAGVGVTLSDTRDGTIVRINQKHCDIIGYTRQEVEGLMTWQQFTHPDDLKADEAFMKRLEGNEISAFDMEKRFIRKDGNIVWVHLNVTRLNHRSGEKPVHIAVVVDITARKILEEEILQAKSEWEATFDAVLDMIFLVDEEDRILRCNQAAMQTFASQYPEILGKSMGHLFFQDAASSSRLEEMDTAGHFPTLSGWYEVSIYPVKFANKPPGKIYVVKDVTTRKQIEEVLLTSQKYMDLGTLAASIAHEINSPLQVITGASDNLLRRIASGDMDADRFQSRLEMINANGWRAAEIIRSMLTYAHSATSNFEACDLNQLISDTLLLVRHRLERWDNVSVVTRLAADLPQLYCERNKISQVLINLVNNARDAMPGGGEITIRTGYDSNRRCLFLKVSDTGTGISAEVKENLFRPFFTTKSIGMGTGLGLFIVKGIVTAHSGEIEVESEPGNTIFTIYLPEHSPAEKAA